MADPPMATKGWSAVLVVMLSCSSPEVCTNCTNYRLGLIPRYFAPTPLPPGDKGWSAVLAAMLSCSSP